MQACNQCHAVHINETAKYHFYFFFILAERYFSRLFHTVGRYPRIILFL